MINSNRGAAFLAVFLLAGCSATTSTTAPTSTASPITTTSVPRETPKPTPTSSPISAHAVTLTPTATVAALQYPSGDPVLKGYPVLVDTKKLDYRIVNWIKTPKSVAVAPGVYADFNPAEPDLAAYLDGPNDGDCAVRNKYFPNTGGACWNGVLAGPQEPRGT